MPFNALVFTLRSKVELNWTRAIRPELSNTRIAYVMHIPNTLGLTSARNNSKQKFQ